MIVNDGGLEVEYVRDDLSEDRWLDHKPDVTQLVEALGAIVSHHDEYFRDSSTESRMPWIDQARAALATYRKGDET